MNVVVKLGGSLINSAPDIVNKLLEYSETSKDRDTILIVPGGGIFADLIRTAGKQYNIGEVASHWMAILAMEQYGYYLIDKTGAKGVGSIDDLQPGISILLPYRLLKKTDELEHSWDVTSDTIAAWMASMINARLVKVTDVDGVLVDNELVQEMGATDLLSMGTTCVDIGLPDFIRANNMDCVVVNGHYPERVIAAVEGENVIGTYIKAGCPKAPLNL
ncbi:MAG: amino acid kinase [Methanosarcinaceae archaeon]|nr:amino acid kinase [Methanosarcinaceae archaeon]